MRRRIAIKASIALACLAISACTKCDKWEKVLSRENSEAVVYVVEEGCSGFSNGMRVAIEVSLKDGQRTTLFRYQDASWNADYYGQTTPEVEWLDKNLLKISIGAVDTVEEKLGGAGDIKVEYHIGHVIAEEPAGKR